MRYFKKVIITDSIGTTLITEPNVELTPEEAREIQKRLWSQVVMDILDRKLITAIKRIREITGLELGPSRHIAAAMNEVAHLLKPDLYSDES